jgi:hypothetical protein
MQRVLPKHKKHKMTGLLLAGAVPMLGIAAPKIIAPPVPAPTTWYQDVLTAIPAPDTPTNEQSLQLWAQSEGVPSEDFNWLATTLVGSQYPTTHLVAPNGGDPVLAYASYATGIAATAQTIRNHPNIEAALENGTSSTIVYRAVNDSSWCWQCQKGIYPEALSNAPVLSTPTSTIPVATTTTGTYVPLLTATNQ